MDETALERAKERLERAAQGRAEPAELEAALERARSQIEALAQAAAELQEGLPEAVQDGLRHHFRPSVRHLAEIRGLMNQLIRRLERVEGDLLADRHARVDDLALLVDLVASGWRTVDERLGRIEQRLGEQGATVYRMEERRA
jgi:vacuolar-type H+-ATPase subunit E/Vma4